MRILRAMLFSFVITASVHAAPAKSGSAQNIDRAEIERLTGVKGALNDKEGVFKVSVPRTDLKVTIGRVSLTPPMGLTSWASFKGSGRRTMVMGDMVLLEDQVGPAMSTALDNGLEVTALHNHFLGDSPKVMFMDIGGMGEQAKLAAAVGKLFANMKETAGGRGAEVSKTEIDPTHSSLDLSKVERVLGAKGELNNGVYKVTIGRETKMHGETVGNTMGVNTWAAFAGSDEKAVVDGDFAMLDSELQRVLKALRGAGINIVAIHQHMAGEVPRILFLHYWGEGSIESLAKGIRAALDTQKYRPSAG